MESNKEHSFSSLFGNKDFISRDEENQPIELKSKEFFSANFDLQSKSSIPQDEMEIMNEFAFYPIVERKTGNYYVLTINKDIRKQLARHKDKRGIRFLSKYAKNLNNIYYTDNQTYFDIVDQGSVIDKEYSDEEAREFFNDLLIDASRKGTSDIHMCWLSDNVEIKYRIDGKMVRQPKVITKELGQALRNIFVNKSGESEYEENEIAGHIAEIIDGKKKEYRVSIGPTVHGYIIVIRTESHINKNTTLVEWGYSPRAVEMIRRLFSYHHGIILVTGATGSGKSTLLYTCIIEKLNESHAYTPEILTVEDPVEIVVEGVNQIQVNTKGDKKNWITFTSAIKMFLRQDPDMIVVGEIRDYDVAIQAVTAAKTGHLTASTLHTNDVKSTFSRLRELGIDNANIEDAIKGVIAQKLLNKLCNHCKIPVEKDGMIYYTRNTEGCTECYGSSVAGCKGRVPIVEIAELNNSPENYKPENFKDYFSLEENIIYLLEQGIIDEEEAKRYMHISERENLSKKKYILDLWNKATRIGVDANQLIFPIYQPILDEHDYIIGLEAFMRIKNEEGEIINPKFFLDLVKQMDMYTKFSMVILDQIISASKKIEKRIFWNIDEQNIFDEDFAKGVLLKFEQYDLFQKIVLEFSFKPEYKNFIQFCNKHGILISLDHFKANMEDIVFMEKNNLKVNYIKTIKEFVDGIQDDEKWLKEYLRLIVHNEGQIIVNFIETDAMLRKIRSTYGSQIFGYQGYGIRKPDYFNQIFDL